MKKTYISIGLVLLLGMGSCEKSSFLNQPPLSFTNPESFFKTESDLKVALVGCYDPINTSNVPGAFVPDGTYSRGLLYILGGGTDEVVPNTSSELADFGRLSYLPSNSPLSALWAAYFAGINRCNLLIEKAEDVNMDATKKSHIIAETRFLRAFYYYHLTVCFGGVPFITSSIPAGNTPRQSVEKIYGLITEDLNFAYTTLTNNPTFIGGANKWTAGGYLGVVYNYLSSCKRFQVSESLAFPLNSFSWVNEIEMSQKAKTVLEDVVNNSGYVLLEKAKYSYLFRETTKADQYRECLFLAQSSSSITDEYPEISNFPIPNGDRNTYGGGYGRLRPTRELYNSFNANDDRRTQNITGAYSSASGKEIINGATYYLPAVANTASAINWCAGKFRCRDPKEKTIPASATSLNYPLLRYADILLQYAEAIYFNGDEATARTYFTEIRRRAVKTGINVGTLNLAYYKADFIEELLDERKRELCFETKRRIDLIRFNKLETALMSINPAASLLNAQARDMQTNYSYFKIWLPIPITQIDINPNLVQNPGY
jgi:hypothetical protein